MGYLGAKSASGAFQAVIAAMPPHDTYIETHLGSGVVMRAKPAASRSIGIDLDPRVLVAANYNGVDLVHGDCVAWLKAFDWSTAGRVLLYVDPPYVLATRTSTKRYRHDYTDDDHSALVEVLRSLPDNVSVMVSGYPSSLYDDLLGDWRTIEFQVMTRGGPRTEKLWMNYDDQGAHWSTFAGRNFLDRLRIRRKAANWRRFYEAMPPGERLAVLAAILSVHSDGDQVAAPAPRVLTSAEAHQDIMALIRSVSA